MSTISPKKLIQAGVHFGHETSRWNPKMEPYIFSSKNKIHIIDIRETIRGLIIARKFIKKVIARGDEILVVGTKYQAREIVRRKASDHEIPYVVDRWLGGTLTNFKTIRSRLERLEEIEQWEDDGTLELYSKKEQSKIMREKQKLLRNLGGIRDLRELPGALVVIDPLQEKIAVSEANTMDIPVIGLIDTDGDPEKVDIPVPCNDEAMRVISMMMDQIIQAKEEGESNRAQIMEEDRKREEQSPEEQAEKILEEERKEAEKEEQSREASESDESEQTDDSESSEAASEEEENVEESEEAEEPEVEASASDEDSDEDEEEETATESDEEDDK